MKTRTELKSEIDNLNWKIIGIKRLGGIVPDSMHLELSKLDSLYKENQAPTELEMLYEKEFRKTSKEIRKKLEEISLQMDEVIALSEESGVPFKSSIRVFDDYYIPESCHDKVDNLDHDFIRKLYGEYNLYYSSSPGWQYSMQSC